MTSDFVHSGMPGCSLISSSVSSVPGCTRLVSLLESSSWSCREFCWSCSEISGVVVKFVGVVVKFHSRPLNFLSGSHG